MASKIAQLVAKIAQDSLQEPPMRPPRHQKTTKSDGGLVVFTLLHFLQRSPPRPPEVPKIAPQLASRWPPKPHLGPAWPHLRANLAKKGDPRRPKTAQDSLQELPTRPPRLRKTITSDGGLVVFTFLHFLQRSPPRPPKLLKMVSQVASRWPPKPHLGPSWRHLGPILAPTWPKRATPDVPRPPQEHPKMPQHRAKTP